jgi:hypothetical protein
MCKSDHLKLWLTFIILTLSGLTLISCAASRSKTSCSAYSSVPTDELFALAEYSRTNQIGWNAYNYDDFAAKLAELQRRADLLLQSDDWVNLRVVRSNNKKINSLKTFAISGLDNHFSGTSGFTSGDFVVVMVPGEFVWQNMGNTTPDKIIDTVRSGLTRHGAKRVMFQCYSEDGFLAEPK